MTISFDPSPRPSPPNHAVHATNTLRGGEGDPIAPTTTNQQLHAFAPRGRRALGIPGRLAYDGTVELTPMQEFSMLRLLSLLLTFSALSGLCGTVVVEAAEKPARVLFVTQSIGYRHGSVTRPDGELAPAEIAMIQLGQQTGRFEVDCTQDSARRLHERESGQLRHCRVLYDRRPADRRCRSGLLLQRVAAAKGSRCAGLPLRHRHVSRV